MRVRTVRLDQEAEEAMQTVVGATGLSASAALKQGILTLSRQLSCQPSASPYDVYATLDLGPGGYARAAGDARPALNYDARYLAFVSDRPSGVGKEDIYLCDTQERNDCNGRY